MDPADVGAQGVKKSGPRLTRGEVNVMTTLHAAHPQPARFRGRQTKPIQALHSRGWVAYTVRDGGGFAGIVPYTEYTCRLTDEGAKVQL